MLCGLESALVAVEVAGRVASLAATYVVEQVGTIEHAYTSLEFSSRCQEAFGIELPAAFWGAAR